ncbi:hypothetical protein RRG08_056045 [Elysia crispata]|uniref:Uncharacterized protein n=1 Tax=Elysia crispata TaxID=231223 RepID=A0AAE1AHH7_9GAST|nr:hypothetical protein RRG08_056045 [Elysia crispata]
MVTIDVARAGAAGKQNLPDGAASRLRPINRFKRVMESGESRRVEDGVGEKRSSVPLIAMFDRTASVLNSYRLPTRLCLRHRKVARVSEQSLLAASIGALALLGDDAVPEPKTRAWNVAVFKADPFLLFSSFLTRAPSRTRAGEEIALLTAREFSFAGRVNPLDPPSLRSDQTCNKDEANPRSLFISPLLHSFYGFQPLFNAKSPLYRTPPFLTVRTTKCSPGLSRLALNRFGSAPLLTALAFFLLRIRTPTHLWASSLCCDVGYLCSAKKGKGLGPVWWGKESLALCVIVGESLRSTAQPCMLYRGRGGSRNKAGHRSSGKEESRPAA